MGLKVLITGIWGQHTEYSCSHKTIWGWFPSLFYKNGGPHLWQKKQSPSPGGQKIASILYMFDLSVVFKHPKMNKRHWWSRPTPRPGVLDQGSEIFAWTLSQESECPLKATRKAVKRVTGTEEILKKSRPQTMVELASHCTFHKNKHKVVPHS